MPTHGLLLLAINVVSVKFILRCIFQQHSLRILKYLWSSSSCIWVRLYIRMMACFYACICGVIHYFMFVYMAWHLSRMLSSIIAQSLTHHSTRFLLNIMSSIFSAISYLTLIKGERLFVLVYLVITLPELLLSFLLATTACLLDQATDGLMVIVFNIQRLLLSTCHNVFFIWLIIVIIANWTVCLERVSFIYVL